QRTRAGALGYRRKAPPHPAGAGHVPAREVRERLQPGARRSTPAGRRRFGSFATALRQEPSTSARSSPAGIVRTSTIVIQPKRASQRAGWIPGWSVSSRKRPAGALRLNRQRWGGLVLKWAKRLPATV